VTLMRAAPGNKQAQLIADLCAARAAFAEQPGDEALGIWVGRRLGYLARYQEAVDHYTQLMRQFGATPRLLRHRGHRFITLRQFARAIEDLSLAQILAASLATEIEPDGIVTPAGPRTTLQGNIIYHLALAHFLAGDLGAAARWWQRAVDTAENDDSLVAATYWLAITQFEAGLNEAARAALSRIRENGMDIRENSSYHRLCLAFKGDVPIAALEAADGPLGIGVDRATLGFGRAMHAQHVRGDKAAADAELAATSALPERAAFGVIAAEAMRSPSRGASAVAH